MPDNVPTVQVATDVPQIVPHKKKRPLNIQQSKLLELLLNGVTGEEALVQAGYARSSAKVLARVRPHVYAAQAAREEQVKRSVMSKDDVVGVQKRIIEDDPSNRTKIAAVQTLVKVLGYESPIKVNQEQTQVLQLRFVLDKPKEE